MEAVNLESYQKRVQVQSRVVEAAANQLQVCELKNAIARMLKLWLNLKDK